jgi:hypothetical protein
LRNLLRLRADSIGVNRAGRWLGMTEPLLHHVQNLRDDAFNAKSLPSSLQSRTRCMTGCSALRTLEGLFQLTRGPLTSANDRAAGEHTIPVAEIGIVKA